VFPLRFGAASATLEQGGPEKLLDAIVKHGVTHLGTAPTAYKATLATESVRPERSEAQSKGAGTTETPFDYGPSDLRSGRTKLEQALEPLRYCISAGEHLPEATWRAWKERTGIAITDGIGSTEMMHIFVSAAGDEVRPGSTGKTVPGYEATVLDPDGNPLEEGIGRLAIKGPTGCRYLDDPRQRDYVENGWNVTGDTYRKDSDGYYWYLARSDDMIVSSGYNIGAPEVENALLSHPAIAECAVIGVPCPERGQKVKAFVVLAVDVQPSDVLVAELQAHAKAQIAPYKYPREIEFVKALPKTATGKLRRSELRQR
jgi:2-aminobenzoate-CoA ligase